MSSVAPLTIKYIHPCMYALYSAVLTHWSVPDNGLAVSQAGLDVGQCLWADIKTHPSLLNVVDVHDLSFNIILKEQ